MSTLPMHVVRLDGSFKASTINSDCTQHSGIFQQLNSRLSMSRRLEVERSRRHEFS